jgi:hypothetical protein
MVRENKLIKRFIRMFKCDTARIFRFPGRIFLILGWNRNTKQDAGQWIKNGEPIDFNYVQETVVASGSNEASLVKSAKVYKKLLKVKSRAN